MSDETRIYVVFDGPPDDRAPRFIEVEDGMGNGVSVGWVERIDGLWALGPFTLPTRPPDRSER